MKRFAFVILLFVLSFEGYGQTTSFYLYQDYVAVRTPTRTASQSYYEFWDTNLGWAGIKSGPITSIGSVTSSSSITSNSSTRPITLSNVGDKGIYGSCINFNSMLNTTVVPNQFVKLGGTSQNGGASIITDYSGNMFFQMYNAKTESASTINYAPQITFQNNGFVGIKTMSPAYELDVCGTIRAKEIKVELNGGCDFVFQKGYKLMRLDELEQYVTSNQHLPEVASATEMVENGVDLKELQMKLLQKIEELTLYTIEQNKKVDAQNLQLQQQGEQIKMLQKKISEMTGKQ